MSKIGFPDVYKGFKMVYYFNDFQADLCYNGCTVDRIKKMWELCLNEKKNKKCFAKNI